MVTRFYRPPEIILQEKKYKPSLDLWSTGCILAELIERQSQIDSVDPLFKGQSCYPMSPSASTDQEDYEKDQLTLIYETLGTQDTQDMSFITDPDARNYAESMLPNKKKVDFSKKYKHTNQELI